MKANGIADYCFEMNLYTAAITLFLVMDPFGNIPIFLSVLQRYDTRKRRRIMIRELVIALVVLLLSDGLRRYLGNRVLKAIERLMGMILTTMSVQMLLSGVREFIAGL